MAHAVARGAWGLAPRGEAEVALLAAGVSAAAAGLASLGRALGCPSPAAGAVAAGVLWLACAGAWWADALAARAPAPLRAQVRQAVVRADPFTAAAYACAGYDRMRWAPLYEGTTVATSTVAVPTAQETAGAWGAAGALVAGIAAVARCARGRREGGA